MAGFATTFLGLAGEGGWKFWITLYVPKKGVESLQDTPEMAKDEFKFPPWLEKMYKFTLEMAKTALKMYTMHGSQPISERKYHQYQATLHNQQQSIKK